MLTYHYIDPIALKFGPITIYWYGLMYLIGFLGAFGCCYQSRLAQSTPWKTDEIMDLFFYAAWGVILGGTWGYLLFYDPQMFLQDPLRALRFWEAGRSFHGGLLGVVIALMIFARVHKRALLDIGDFIAPAVPIGLATGRVGNFINGELWGRVTDMPWGIVFPGAGSLPRHPSQLYEFGTEGVGLFIILYWYTRKPRPRGAASGLFLAGYGVFRFLVEFFREPDADQGYLALGWVTKGQVLSLPMILIGLVILFYAYQNRQLNRR